MAEHFDKRSSAYRREGFCPSCAAHAADGHAIGFTKVPTVCDECRNLPAPDRAGHHAYRWTRQGPIEPREIPEVLCPCGSKVSGAARWGDRWGGGCDRAEERVVNLMERMGLPV